MAKMIKVTVNGQNQQFPCGATLSDVMQEFAQDKSYCVIELNGMVISRQDHPSTPLASGDHLELISPVGGG